MIRIAALTGLALAALAAVALADKDKGEKKDEPKAKVYETPQDVFDAYVAAEKKDDYKTMFRCLSPRAQKEMAVSFAGALASNRAALEELKGKDAQDAVKKMKPIYDVFDKHGLTAKVTKELDSKDAREKEKAKQAVLAALKDPEAFLVELFTAASKTGLEKYDPSGPATLKLTKVKIRGDKATGVVVRTTKGKDDKEKVEIEPANFVKVGGGWRIDQGFEFSGEK